MPEELTVRKEVILGGLGFLALPVDQVSERSDEPTAAIDLLTLFGDADGE